MPAVVLTTSLPAHATSTNSTLSVDIASATITAGASSNVTATVKDSQGRPWAGQLVTLSLSGPSGSSLGTTTGTTNSAGQVTTTLSTDTFTANGATLTVTATSGPLTNTDTATITGGVTLALTTTPAITQSQTGGINAGRANKVTATLTNAGGTGISGQTITFSYTGITGTLSATTATTNASGVAEVTLTPDTWTTPGTSTTITATTAASTGTVTTNATPIVLGANALAAGWNNQGQLGSDDYANRYALTQLVTVFPSPIKQIASGGYYSSGTTSSAYFTLFLLENETVWAVGNNSLGQLGLGDTTSRTIPTQISSLSGIKQIVAGDDTGYALTKDSGEVYAWGHNDGINNTGSDTLTPVKINGLGTNVKAIAAGAGTGYALTSSNGVMAWGQGADGQLGNGSLASSGVPVNVSGLTSGVRMIVAGRSSAYAVIDATGEVRSWGRNFVGQLGDNSITTRSAPVTVSGLTGVDELTAGDITVYARIGGAIKAWGANQATVVSGVTSTGMIGDNSTIDRWVPVNAIGSGVTSVGSSAFNGYALLSDGTVKAWGYNYDGQLGNSQPAGSASSLSPITVPSVPAGRTIVGFATGSMSAVSTLMITAP